MQLGGLMRGMGSAGVIRFVILLSSPVFAGELSLLGGYGWTTNPAEKTYAWQIQYLEGLGEHFAYSLSYLNQGHFTDHHRDANAVNLWLSTNLLDRHLSLGVGAGACSIMTLSVQPTGLLPGTFTAGGPW